MKTKITVNSNEVTVERDDFLSGERISTTYFVPHRGGYVRVRDDAGRNPQVCEMLFSTGSTLDATVETLPAIIRRELRRRNAFDRKNQR